MKQTYFLATLELLHLVFQVTVLHSPQLECLLESLRLLYSLPSVLPTQHSHTLQLLQDTQYHAYFISHTCTQ